MYLPFLIATLVALTVFIGFSAYDIVVLGQEPHAEYPPQSDLYHIIRMLACIILSIYMAYSLPATCLTPAPISKIAMASSMLLWVVAAIFLVSPKTFTALGVEDSLVEWASAILVFLACIQFSRVAFRLRGVAASIAVFMAVFLFVLGMEEISWMQRVFDYQTPQAFAQNGQREFNLHNFQTNRAENLYYICAFALLFGLPFLLTPFYDRLPAQIRAVVPSHTVVLAAAPMAALNWDMWNIIPIQMMYWIAVFSLGAVALNGYRAGNRDWPNYGFACLSILIIQMVFLGNGTAFERQWDVTEYKELFISIGFVVFAMQAEKGCPRRS